MKLNKTILTTLVIGISSLAMGSTSTLEAEGRAPSLGIQGGLNFEMARSPGEISSNSRTGFSVGVNIEAPLARGVSLQPELIYSRRGLNLVDVGGVRADVNYHALEVPVLAKVTFGEGIRPYVFAGPMAVWNISNEVVGSAGGSTGSVSFDPRTLDFAAVGGLGVEVGALFVNARYALGLIDINDNSAEWRSRGFKLMAGVKF